jgi:hypothetical protein
MLSGFSFLRNLNEMGIVIRLRTAVKINILRHPEYMVKKPPKVGPRLSPRYTAATFIPNTLPRSSLLNVEVRIAIAVEYIRAPPMPFKTLEVSKSNGEPAMADKIDAVKKTKIPPIKSFFRPYRSDNLPKGSRNIAAASRYALETQPSCMVFIERSTPIAGSAILMAEPIKGVRNELSVVTKSMADLGFIQNIFYKCIVNCGCVHR